MTSRSQAKTILCLKTIMLMFSVRMVQCNAIAVIHNMRVAESNSQ